MTTEGAGSDGGAGQGRRTAAERPSGRLDVWLWSVRLFPSRSAATQACRAGRVRIGGVKAKAAAVVRPGDRITFRAANRDRDVVVLRVLATRVGAPIAVTSYEDHSPPAPPRQAALATRESGTGRPTKKERRQITRLRGH